MTKPKPEMPLDADGNPFCCWTDGTMPHNPKCPVGIKEREALALAETEQQKVHEGELMPRDRPTDGAEVNVRVRGNNPIRISIDAS